MLGVARGTRLGHRLALVDVGTAPYEKRSEMRERGFVAARGDDGDRGAVRRNLTGEGHLAGRGRADDGSSVDRDIDPAVLSGRVRVVAHGEAPEHRALGRPAPPERIRSREQHPAERGENDRSESRCLSR